MSKKNQKNTSVFESLPEDQKDFFILSLEKKVRNLNKKLKEITLLEQDRKEGKELNEAQLKKIASRDEHNSKIKEQESIAKLYLEAKEEAGPQQTQQINISDIIAEASIQISHLYYASLFSHQTKAQNELNLAYQNIFNSIADNRVQASAAELTAYASGQLGDLQAQVREVISSDEFAHYHRHVTEVEERVIVVIPQQNDDVVLVVNQTEVQEANQQVEEEEEQQHQQQQQNQDNTQEQQQSQQVEQEVEVQITFIEGVVNPQTQQAEQQQQEQEQQQQDQQQQPQDPTQDKQKKTYPKRTHSGGNQNRGHRAQKPREGEQQNQDGNTNPENQEGQHQQQRRGPKNNYNKKPRNEDNTNSQNQNTGDANDGWNVVRKVTGPQEGNFKQNRPFNREQREHKEHREGGKRPENQGEKRQNNSGGNGNRRPFNNNRNEPQAQYVRKDQPSNNQPATQPQQEEKQQANQTN